MHIDNNGLCKIVITTLICLILVTNLITYSVTDSNSYRKGIIVGLMSGWKACEIKDPNTTMAENTYVMVELIRQIESSKDEQ